MANRGTKSDPAGEQEVGAATDLTFALEAS
jgi:hypothetical protein